MVSERAQQGLEIPRANGGENKLHHDDPFHDTENRDGYIHLGSADSVLCADVIKEKFDAIDWRRFDTNQMYVYPRGGGEISTLDTVANFINSNCRKGLPPIPAEEIVMVPGVTTGVDLLGQILFDSGDVLLVPAPYYFRFVNDFGDRGLVQIVPVPALSEEGMCSQLLVERFEQAYQEGNKLGKVRAITLVNPQNPEGEIFSLDEIRPIVQWALSRNLYVVLDEIYDLTIYDEDPEKPFESATQLFFEKSVEPTARNKLIWLWGLSKNFSLPGLRTAVLYTPNQVVRAACTRFLMHHLPNVLTQFITREFLGDQEWVEKKFIPTNLRRLKAARDQVLARMDKLGVKYLKPRAGYFALVDFSKFLDEPSFEAERRLQQRFLANKVIINPGETMFVPKPGWFRIVFTSVDSVILDEALERITKALLDNQRAQIAKTDQKTNGIIHSRVTETENPVKVL